MPEIVKITGLKELDAALAELPKATAKNVLKRTLMKAADPIERQAEQNAPEITGRLKRSIVSGTRLTRSQREDAPTLQTDGSYRSAAKSSVTVYVGTAMSRALYTEFGTSKEPAQMWFTRAWESTRREALEIISTTLVTEVEKAAARLAKKAAKL